MRRPSTQVPSPPIATARALVAQLDALLPAVPGGILALDADGTLRGELIQASSEPAGVRISRSRRTLIRLRFAPTADRLTADRSCR